MNILVIGLGSMGRRRIRLLQQIDKEMRVLGVDTNQERRKQAADEFEIQTYPTIDEAACNENCFAAFIATSPLSHNNIIKNCLKRRMNVFTEINLDDEGYDENIAFAEKANRTLFLSSTFMYRKEIEYIRKRVNDVKEIISYSYHVGQYLPDWHPWENYKDFFVGKKESNGCRELMAIEFPWIVDTFGEVVEISVFSGKASSLEIDCPDTYHILLKHTNGNMGSVQVDVVSRKAVRNLEVISEHLHIRWNGKPETLFEYDINTHETKKIYLYERINRLNGYDENIIEDAYMSEILNFFSVIEGKETPKHTFAENKSIIELINRIEG